MAPLISIRSSDDKLEIVNQLLLPHITEFIEINSVEDAHDAIKSMKVCLASTVILSLIVIPRFEGPPLSLLSPRFLSRDISDVVLRHLLHPIILLHQRHSRPILMAFSHSCTPRGLLLSISELPLAAWVKHWTMLSLLARIRE